MEDRKKRLRTVGLIMVITMIGKVLGLVRDMLLGHNFGTGMESSAFLTASRIPRTFFDAIFAAAISSSFIPIFAERLEKHGKDDAFRLSRSFMTWVGLLTALLSVLGIIFARPLVSLLAAGYDPETTALCTSLLRILFPIIFFTGIAFSMVGILQSMDQFYIPAALSVVSNAIIILYYLLFCREFGIYGLAIAFLLGWAAQAVMQVPWLIGHHVPMRPSLRHPALKDVFFLMLPVMVSTWNQPINQLISTRFASYLFGGSGTSAMEYANTLYTMIAGILVLSLTNVIFPEMSRLSSSGEKEKLGRVMGDSIRSLLFLLLPMTAGLMLLSRELVQLLYEYGSWDSFSTTITSRALCYMSLGMVGYGAQNVLCRMFYAEQNGKIPMASGAVSIAVNLVLCLLLSEPMDVAGLALATALSSLAGALVLLIPALRRYPGAFGQGSVKAIGKMILCTAGMCAAVIGAKLVLSGIHTENMIGRLLFFGAVTLVGIIVYFALAALLRLDEMETVLRFVRRGKKDEA